MSRTTKLLIKCIQHSTVYRGRIKSIRVRTDSSEAECVRIDFRFLDSGELFFFGDLFSVIGIFSEDLIAFGDTDSRASLSKSVDVLDKSVDQCREVSFVLFRESFSLKSFLSAVQSQTVFGMPEVFRGPDFRVPEFFVGASKQPQKLATYQQEATAIGIDGLTVVIQGESGGQIEFLYLNPLGELHKRSIAANIYLSEEIREKVYRYKFQNVQGFRVFLRSTNVAMEQDQPLRDSEDFKRHISTATEGALNEFLLQQVAQIERRISVIPKRRRVYFNGEELGLEPDNELETVILFERYLHRNANKLGTVASFRLLEYSPQGIDSICEFSPDSKTPKVSIGAEFEFHLKNFFHHGHDPNQIGLILCYTKRDMEFPYVHFGATYDIDRSGPIPRLLCSVTSKSAYLFILDEILECR